MLWPDSPRTSRCPTDVHYGIMVATGWPGCFGADACVLMQYLPEQCNLSTGKLRIRAYLDIAHKSRQCLALPFLTHVYIPLTFPDNAFKYR